MPTGSLNPQEDWQGPLKHRCALPHLTFTPVWEAGRFKLSPFPENYSRSSQHPCDIHSCNLRRPSWGRFCNNIHCGGGMEVRIHGSWHRGQVVQRLGQGTRPRPRPSQYCGGHLARSSWASPLLSPAHRTASRPTPSTAHRLVALHGPRLRRTPRPRSPTSQGRAGAEEGCSHSSSFAVVPQRVAALRRPLPKRVVVAGMLTHFPFPFPAPPSPDPASREHQLKFQDAPTGGFPTQVSSRGSPAASGHSPSAPLWGLASPPLLPRRVGSGLLSHRGVCGTAGASVA